MTKADEFKKQAYEIEAKVKAALEVVGVEATVHSYFKPCLTLNGPIYYVEVDVNVTLFDGRLEAGAFDALPPEEQDVLWEKWEADRTTNEHMSC